jgi:hypothetical protein
MIRHRSLSTPFASLLALSLASVLAHADCGPVIAAYSKAEATGRYGWYNAIKIDETPKPPMIMMTIGKDVWYDQTEEGKMFSKWNLRVAQKQADDLRDDEKKGDKRCEPLGDRVIRGEPAVGFITRNNGKSKEDLTAIHVYISKSTGLPIWHGFDTGGGYHWVYGAVVTPPPANKVKS